MFGPRSRLRRLDMDIKTTWFSEYLDIAGNFLVNGSLDNRRNGLKVGVLESPSDV